MRAFFKMGSIALASASVDVHSCFIATYQEYYSSWIIQSENKNSPVEK
jgi:hypothetical protein